MPNSSDTAPLKTLSPAELAVCSNVGGRLATGEIDASTALRWLQGWSSSTPGAVDAREGVDGARDDAAGSRFVLPVWLLWDRGVRPGDPDWVAAELDVDDDPWLDDGREQDTEHEQDWTLGLPDPMKCERCSRPQARRQFDEPCCGPFGGYRGSHRR